MKRKSTVPIKTTLAFVFLFIGAITANSQTLPTAKSIAAEMGMAWNLGNTMEAIGGPTAWGNPFPTQQLMDSVKAAGFNTIRIPCAWDGNADQTTYEINPEWMAQVKTVVDYGINAGLYVILNIHWDGGWLEENINPAVQMQVNLKQGAYWRQIATTFRDYDQHLLFAGANEPAVQDEYGTEFGEDRMAVLTSYLQTFIDTVRATGGNNASRTLIIQGPHADIELTNDVMNTLPTDVIADRLMAEVHFYPYQFTLMTEDADWGKMFYYWGQENHSTTDTERNPTWGEEAFVDSVFDLMKVKFADKNIPVVIGEFGAIKRLALTGDVLERHLRSRRCFYNYVVAAAHTRGMIPVNWDTGSKGNHTMTIFDRTTCGIYDLGLLNAMREGVGLPKLSGDTSLIPVSGDNAMKILYSAKDSLWGQVDLGVLQSDFTGYDSIIVRAYLNGESNYDSAGTTKYGWVSLSAVTMSDEWTWREAPLGDLTMNTWANYRIPIGTDTADTKALVPANPAKVDFFALQAYSTGYRGTIYIDYIAFKGKNGTIDTLYTFDMMIPDNFGGNVQSVTSIAVSDVASDTEWKTATSKYPSTSVISSMLTHKNIYNIITVRNKIRAGYNASSTGIANVNIVDLRGRSIASRLFRVTAGMNALEIPVSFHGMMIVRIQQGDTKVIRRVTGR
jgi:aryl-phospho-beta-D-glucosidase BglC (GH1 family)